jgi:hypothetical protein
VVNKIKLGNAASTMSETEILTSVFITISLLEKLDILMIIINWALI